ncbi:hypothetical protein QJS04_geneDACA018273 [Acorus gramineus]|uniref:Uncharacterized protein n=1 Tax=Acorus gramineus TaxID=55184 RepID=A0AAV9BDE8_ACOGR|nr:hypothetical protein QJS04_geneDACA018273 [Acorus gramineus]
MIARMYSKKFFCNAFESVYLGCSTNVTLLFGFFFSKGVRQHNGDDQVRIISVQNKVF